jgi:rhodanese-related sulfurtransferase
MTEEIDPALVIERMRAGSVLLDVREPDEWNEAHVAGALHIPLGELSSRLDELPVDREIICMCRSGRRSAEAQKTLAARGRGGAVLNMTGGIVRWSELALPLERGA